MLNSRTLKAVACCGLLLMLTAILGCAGALDRATSQIALTRSEYAMNRGDALYRQGDYRAAAGEYRSAADMNNPRGQYLLGRMHAKGEGVTRDAREALRWIMMSSDQGYPPADVDMGLRYLYGNDVPVDYEKAVFHFLRAAEREYVLAMYYMALVNAHGLGVRQSRAEALRWFRMARAYGFPLDDRLTTEQGVAEYMASQPASPVRAAAPAETVTTRLLDTANRDDASAIQARLANLGFYTMRVDGLWGPGSANALRNFQRANGIRDDGLWNMETQMKLFP